VLYDTIMSEISSWNKEELYDVIAALSATIRSLTNEIVELQGVLLHIRGVAA